MGVFASREDVAAIEAEMPWDKRGMPASIYGFLSQTKSKFGSRPAITFQIQSNPQSAAKTLTWDGFHARVTQAANLFRSLGVGEKDVVAYVLPNSLETAVTLLGGATAGIVNPINPLLDAEQIGAILNETKAKVVVTLRAFPKTDVPQKVAAALAYAPGVQTVLEVDLLGYITGVKRLIVPLIRPKNPSTHRAKVLSFNAECDKQPSDRLTFADRSTDHFAALFHTGGTTGMPKVAQHKASGMIYNGWLGQRLLFSEKDVVICPLPMFHVFATYPILMSSIASGFHTVFPTPAGYRGEGVFDNFWKLIERWGVTYMVTVPTALSALMQRPIDAKVSTLRGAFSGSAPLPIELFNRFEAATGVQIVEGYGMTEATCLVSINPPEGGKKIGSVGLPFPYTRVRILAFDENGKSRDCGPDESGEICVTSPGVVVGATYTEADKNKDLFDGDYLRTGDLGRIDSDGYLYITGRAKDLIIRGGHNIDPALIEEALMGHPQVAFVGAIGQPDAHAGELPCAYVEVIKGASVTEAELMAYADSHIPERAAMPKHLQIIPEIPKTGVGKTFKPDLRRMAITRVYDDALAAAGLSAHVAGVIEDKKRGLVAQISAPSSEQDGAIDAVLGQFIQKWERLA
jgi:fatty-acyl-CoA synthase